MNIHGNINMIQNQMNVNNYLNIFKVCTRWNVEITPKWVLERK